MDAFKNGSETSEFTITQGAQLWSKIAFIIGLFIVIGSAVADFGGKTGVIVGGAVMILSRVEAFLVASGYIKSRTVVKELAVEQAATELNYKAAVKGAEDEIPVDVTDNLTGRVRIE